MGLERQCFANREDFEKEGDLGGGIIELVYDVIAEIVGRVRVEEGFEVDV